MSQKILVVDDELETLRLIGMMLQRQGYEIIASASSNEVLDLAKKEKPDLIILDIMMPEKDGYQITRELRENKETSQVPILMFTAKSQIDDKVAGYEAGADDYLTKPVHPAELVAHVKSLLTRRRKTSPLDKEKIGYTLGVITPKGGLGSSSFVMNLAISYQREIRDQVIAAELRPGHGSWGLDLGYPEAVGLNNLLQLMPTEVTIGAIKEELVRTISGELLLMSSYDLKDVSLINSTEQIDAIVQLLSQIAPFVILDLGTTYLLNIEQVLENCQEIVLLTEPYPAAIERSKHLIDYLSQYGFGKYKLLSVVLNNRTRSDMQYSASQIELKLGKPVFHIISPTPENSFKADERHIPLTKNQPDGLITQQYNQLALMIKQHITSK